MPERIIGEFSSIIGAALTNSIHEEQTSLKRLCEKIHYRSFHFHISKASKPHEAANYQGRAIYPLRLTRFHLDIFGDLR